MQVLSSIQVRSTHAMLLRLLVSDQECHETAERSFPFELSELRHAVGT